MTTTVRAAGPSHALTVSYLCSAHHIDVRYYNPGTPVLREIVCALCGWPGWITPAEMQRHELLHDDLKGRLVDS